MDKLVINCMTGEETREPFTYTPEQIAAQLVRDEQDRCDCIKAEATNRKKSLVPGWSEDYETKRDSTMKRAIALTRRESKGIATVDEIAELDDLEAIGEAIESIDSVADTAILAGTALVDIIWPT